MTAASLLGIGGLLALPLFTLPAILGGAPVSPGLVHTALLGLAGFGLFVAGGVVVMVTDRPLALLGRIGQRLWNSLPGRHTKITGLDRRLLRQRDDIRSTLGHDWLRAVVLTAGRLGFDYGCLLCALRATGSRPRPSLVLLAYAAAGIVALVPITPGGLGIVEASLSGLLVLAGVPGGKALVATLAYRLASYWLPLLAGLLAYVLFRRRYPPVCQGGRNHPAGPMKPEVSELPPADARSSSNRWPPPPNVRRAADVLRLILAVAVLLVGLLVATLAHDGVRSTERGLLETIVTLPASLRDR